jgi:hypothetical protein
MELGATRRLTLSVGFLIVIQLLTSLSVIILLERMSPAIERILLENVASVLAVEEMALALAESPADDAARGRFFGALTRAKRNVTEEEERPALAEIEAAAAAALAGDVAARRRVAQALQRLGDVNRQAMQRADDNARRIGTGGAWAAVFLGLTGLVASAITIRRLERRLLGPIAEIMRVVAAQRGGDRRSRCTGTYAQGELGPAIHTLNELFDLRERVGESIPQSRGESDDRALLLYLLDERDEPVAIAGPRGDVLAANRRALDILLGATGTALRAEIAAAVRSGRSQAGISLRRVGDSEQWLCAIPEPANLSQSASQG